MYMLLPDEPNIGFVTLAVVFVSATLLGFASHAPGGLGVFDAAMLVALWQFDKEDVLAGLLLFRLLYYLAPFVVALIILGTREIWLNMRGARAKPALHPVTSVTAPLRSEIESREDQRRLTMASEDNSANLPRGADWPSRLRGAWLALLGRLGADANRRAGAADIRPHRRASAGAADRVADRRTARTGDRARPRRPRHRLQRGGVGDRAVAAPRRTGLDHLAHAGIGRCDPARHRQPDAATGGILRARAARPLVRGLRDAGASWRRRRRRAPTFC